jgi:DNA-3-methyladenine glycosylase
MAEPLDYRLPPAKFAEALIGATLTLQGVGGPIVEAEAYDADDPASHSYRGPSARNAAMFGEVGRAYVYRIYGMHWCLNIVCGDRPGGAVLIRALEPALGLDAMSARRGTDKPELLCSGPGKLCQALGVTRDHDGLRIDEAPFSLTPAAGRHRLLTGPRIGITKGAETPWRFGLAGSKFVSRRF